MQARNSRGNFVGNIGQRRSVPPKRFVQQQSNGGVQNPCSFFNQPSTSKPNQTIQIDKKPENKPAIPPLIPPQELNQIMTQSAPSLQQQEQAVIPETQNNPSVSGNTEEMKDESDGGSFPKRFMVKRKITREIKEKRARLQNRRLRKILKPRNALAVLNDLHKNHSFKVVTVSPTEYAATLTIDGLNFDGTGSNKQLAKLDAAEIALKHFVLQKLLADKPATDGNGDVEMKNADDEDNDISFAPIAAFAMYKLMCSWGEAQVIDPPKVIKHNPAKRIPENPLSLHPIMVVNQVFPNATFEMVCETAVQEKKVMTMKLKIGDKSFVGTAPSKKKARRVAAIYACRELLNIEYPMEEEI